MVEALTALPTEGNVTVKLEDPHPLDGAADIWAAKLKALRQGKLEVTAAMQDEEAAKAKTTAALEKLSQLASDEREAFEAVQSERAKADLPTAVGSDEA